MHCKCHTFTRFTLSCTANVTLLLCLAAGVLGWKKGAESNSKKRDDAFVASGQLAKNLKKLRASPFRARNKRAAFLDYSILIGFIITVACHLCSHAEEAAVPTRHASAQMHNQTFVTITRAMISQPAPACTHHPCKVETATQTQHTQRRQHAPAPAAAAPCPRTQAWGNQREGAAPAKQKQLN